MWLRLVVLSLVIAAAIASGSAAATWRVEKDGSGDYTSIQPAVDGASPGDTILIGPGRYVETSPFSPKASWPIDTHVAVTVDSLVFIGEGPELAIVGPEKSNFYGNGPKGFVTSQAISRITIEDVTIENVYSGIYATCCAEIGNCVFRGCEAGVVSFSQDGLVVETCYFDYTNDGYGVMTWPPAANVSVRNSEFINTRIGVNFVGTSNAAVNDCSFIGGIAGIQYERGSAGSVEDCTFRDASSTSIILAINSDACIMRNDISGGQIGVAVITDSHLSGSANVLHGGSHSTIDISTSHTDFHGNHILKGDGYLVWLRAFVDPPNEIVDLKNNYWGIVDSDSIANLIWDGYDDPDIHGFVEYEPFSAVPLESVKKSLGGVKALYR